MSVLVAYGSKPGGTAGRARMIGALARQGVVTNVRAATDAGSPETYDGVIVAGALYANRWHRRARALRGRPVWLVSSGPLDDTARAAGLAPVPQVARLAARIGTRGQVTSGGRLEPDAKGLPASAMAKTRAGDWRHPEHIRDLAAAVATDLATLEPVAP